MRILRKTFAVLFVLLIILSVSVLIYLTSQKPQYSGTLQLKGLQEKVSVVFDFYGVPHIYANNEEDAYFALGYVHAQDRLFQMEMTRRIATGRLSEIFGKEYVRIDHFFKTLCLEEQADSSAKLYLSGITQSYQRAAYAYVNGINSFMEKGRTPVEFTMLHIPKEKFTPRDIYLATGYMAFNFAMGFRTDPLMSYINSKLGNKYMDDIVTGYNPGAILNSSYHVDSTSVLIPLKNTTTAMLEKLPVPPFMGSNGWVLSPSLSRSGKVLFANDTHIGYSQPSVWYEAHIEYPGFSFYGNHLAGFPFAPVGHNRFCSIGLTMFENDDVDFYRERISKDDKYKVWENNQWVPLKIIEKNVKVKGEPDHKLMVRISNHGPLVQGVMPEWKYITSDAVSVFWTYLKFRSNLVQLTYNLNHAQSMDAARDVASQIISPGINIMYGDSTGNIAWWAAAKLIKRAEGVNPVLLLDGISGTQDVKGFYDFKDNPQSENPPQGYVYSANGQPDTVNGNFYPGYYAPGDRATRITQLLNDKTVYSIEDMQRINADAISTSAPAIADIILEQINKSLINKTQAHYSASKILLAWNGDHQLLDVAPTIYYKLLYNVLELAMKDELGETNFNVFLKTHAMKNTVPRLIADGNSVWWDNVNTKKVKETRTLIFIEAFDRTINELVTKLGTDVNKWEWGRVHFLEEVHPIGMRKPFNLMFDVGPAAVPGGNEVINCIGFDLNNKGIYKASYGPAMRIVLDFADIENSKSVLPTGQSGNIMSNYYNDQAVMYNTGKFRKQKMNRKEILSNKTGTLIFQPMK